jgi:hypothetical protein
LLLDPVIGRCKFSIFTWTKLIFYPQNLPQSFWPIISSYNPDLFIWLGDSVYAKDNTISGLLDAYHILNTNSYYDQFRKKHAIVGTWDDHGKLGFLASIIL